MTISARTASSDSTKRKPFIWLLALFLGLFATQSATALTFDVDNFQDFADTSVGDGVCANGGGFCTLRAAVMEGNALSGPHIINLPAGTYTLSIASGSSDSDASIGDLDFSSNQWTLNGAGAGQTVIDASAMNHRAFEIPVNLFFSGSVTFNDLTMQGGNTSSLGSFNSGAAVRIGSRFPSSITFNRVEVINNTGASAIFTVADTSIDQSRISNNSGTGLFQSNDGAQPTSNVRTLDISDSTFEGNASSGIAIGNNDGGSLINSTVSGNGLHGIQAQFTNNNDFIITNSTIANNAQDGVAGIGYTIFDPMFGDIPVRPDILVRNSIVADNVRSDFTTPALDDQSEVPQSDGFNVISDNSGAPNFNQSGDLTNTDPLLQPIALNSPGSLRTHALGPASPAIDSASSSFAPAFDQRGVTRPQGAADDSGSYEFLPTLSNLSVVKTADVSDAVLGQAVQFTVVVANSGPDAAIGADFSDIPDTSFTNVSWTCTASGGASCSASGTGAIQDVIALPNGGNVTYTVDAVIAESAQSPAINMATVSPPPGGSDPTPGDNQDSVSITVDNSVDIAISATQCIDVTAPGFTHQLAVQFENSGANAAPNTTIGADFPQDFIVLSAPVECTAIGGVEECDVGNVDVGQSGELVFIVEVDAQAADGPLDSLFMAASVRPDAAPGNNADALVTQVLSVLVSADSFESCGEL